MLTKSNNRTLVGGHGLTRNGVLRGGLLRSKQDYFRPVFQIGESSNIALLRGIGDPTFTRTSTCTVIDHEGALWTMPANCALRSGARFVDHGDSEDYGLGPCGMEAFDTTVGGALISPAPMWEHQGPSENKCTNYNADPDVGLTNITFSQGGSGATFSRVDDSSELAAAGLSRLCGSGYVFKLDLTSADSWAVATISGQTGNTNPHSFSCYMRCNGGSSSLKWSDNSDPVSTSSPTYVRIAQENSTPSGSAVKLKVVGDIGYITYFILNQLEEGPAATAIITVAGAAASRTTPTWKYDLAGNADETNGTLVLKGWTPAFAETVVAAAQGMVGFADASLSAAHLEAGGDLGSADGTNIASKALAFTDGNEYHIALRWNLSTLKMQIGYRDVTGAGTWQWSAEATFDGAYAVGSFLQLFYTNAYPQKFRDILIWKRDMGTAFVEVNY